MTEIGRRTGLVTVSLGSGPDADVIFLFTEDICGGEGRRPRHARTYGNLKALQERVKQERIKALSAFRADVNASAFPGPHEISQIDDDEFAAFTATLQQEGF
ncbi:hypothetical protein Q3C01_15870 [Bradyrhizobium sp. UFLA05-109]